MQVFSNTGHSFPKTLDEFKNLFLEENISLEFLFQKRWPQGFVCPYCAWQNEELRPAKTMICSHCGHPTSISTNTIMHGTKKPLSQWLICIWWLTSSPGGKSAKDLQRLLHLSSYQTAWAWLQKLRMAMALADKKKCSKTVEISSNTISFGGENLAKTPILAAAEIILPAGITGRIKMASVESVNRKTVNSFLNRKVEPGSSLIVPDEVSYQNINRNSFISVASSTIYRTREITESFKLWINTIHRGGVAAKHLQLYLDEFCFHSNAAMLPDREAIFNLLLSGALSKKSLSYKNLTSQPTKE
jgi:hypothetical protein